MAKRNSSFLLVLLLMAGVLLSACVSNTTDKQQQESLQTEVSTLTGEFQGLADGHSVEIFVEEEPQVYQFFDESVTAKLETMETGTLIQFDVEIDAETEIQTIVKVYDTPAQG